MCVSCRPWRRHSTEDRGSLKQTGGLPLKFARVPPEALYLKRVHYCDDG